jgi:hypothetical protein
MQEAKASEMSESVSDHSDDLFANVQTPKSAP